MEDRAANTHIFSPVLRAFWQKDIGGKLATKLQERRQNW
jgi:hypothetical protein